MAQSADPDEIRQRMAAVRRRLDDDVDDVIEGVRQLADWRHYVRRYPWAVMGVAVAVGYTAVPRQRRIAMTDGEDISRLPRRDRVNVELAPQAAAKSSIAGAVAGWIVSQAVRAGAVYLANQFELRRAESPHVDRDYRRAAPSQPR